MGSASPAALQELVEDSVHYRIPELADLAEAELASRQQGQQQAGSGGGGGTPSQPTSRNAAPAASHPDGSTVLNGQLLAQQVVGLSSVAVAVSPLPVSAARAVVLSGMTRYNSAVSSVCKTTSFTTIFDPATGSQKTIEVCTSIKTAIKLGAADCEPNLDTRCICIESAESIPNTACTFATQRSGGYGYGSYNPAMGIYPSGDMRTQYPFLTSTCTVNGTRYEVNQPPLSVRVPFSSQTRGLPAYYMCRQFTKDQLTTSFSGTLYTAAYSSTQATVFVATPFFSIPGVGNLSLATPLGIYRSAAEVLSVIKLQEASIDLYARGWLLRKLQMPTYDLTTDSFVLALNVPTSLPVPVTLVDSDRQPLYRGGLDSPVVSCGHPDLQQESPPMPYQDFQPFLRRICLLTGPVVTLLDNPSCIRTGCSYGTWNRNVWLGPYLPAGPSAGGTESVQYPARPYSARVMAQLINAYGLWIDKDGPHLPRTGLLKFLNDGAFFGTSSSPAPVQPVV